MFERRHEETPATAIHDPLQQVFSGTASVFCIIVSSPIHDSAGKSVRRRNFPILAQNNPLPQARNVALGVST
ncbi:hypothetical protein CES86_1856 [Brucella lupini]|uniref:Uncharacterized protein n=1 Tax=Brucella lupini TaxID=255457 RepID=A0A256GVE7_9HYPH|nr:hypothetical protein CES86_1856 [Brucella lupini]